MVDSAEDVTKATAQKWRFVQIVLARPFFPCVVNSAGKKNIATRQLGRLFFSVSPTSVYSACSAKSNRGKRKDGAAVTPLRSISSPTLVFPPERSNLEEQTQRRLCRNGNLVRSLLSNSTNVFKSSPPTKTSTCTVYRVCPRRRNEKRATKKR